MKPAKMKKIQQQKLSYNAQNKPKTTVPNRRKTSFKKTLPPLITGVRSTQGSCHYLEGAKSRKIAV